MSQLNIKIVKIKLFKNVHTFLKVAPPGLIAVFLKKLTAFDKYIFSSIEWNVRIVLTKQYFILKS